MQTFDTRIGELVSTNFQQCPCSFYYMNAVKVILYKAKLDVEISEENRMVNCISGW